jgi:uncharacterized SAM-binding protein YcdF (DUF218 family)
VIGLRRLLLGILVLAVLWLGGLVAFATAIAGLTPADPGRTTDAIVVLTGGSERLPVAFDLLEEGRAHKLYISGVYRGVDVRELLQRSGQPPGELECCIELGHADDTDGNAVESAAWIAREGFQSVRLVTANYHMPRALIEFRRRVPEVTIIAHPVTPHQVHMEAWWRWPGTASLLTVEYNKFLAAWLRSWLTAPPATAPR